MQRSRIARLLKVLPVALFVLCSMTAFAGDVRIDRTVSLDPGGRLMVDVSGAKITVTGSSRTDARVVVRSPRDDLEEIFDIKITGTGDEARVIAKRRDGFFKGLFGMIRGVRLSFEIEIPDRADVFLDTSGGSIRIENVEGETELDTSGGSITATSMVGPLLADTSGGSITVTSIRGRTVLDTSGGAIRATEVFGDLVADTSGGSISIEGVTGRVDAETSGGSISAVFGPGNDAGGTLSTSGGGITVMLDPAISLEIDAATSGGGVSTDLPITVQGKLSKRAIQGTLNDGGNLLRVRTSGGSIRIKSL